MAEGAARHDVSLENESGRKGPHKRICRQLTITDDMSAYRY
jgi:hypothetical protein